MLQFLRFDKNVASDTEFSILPKGEAGRFFLRHVGFVLLLLYSTIFLAVAIPYEGTFFIGGIITAVFMIRLINFIIKYRKFKGGAIRVSPEMIEIRGNEEVYKIPADEITYIEVNVFSDLVVREKYNKTVFPISLLTEDDREMLLNNFVDMAPNRTRIYHKAWDFFDAILVAFILAMHIRQFIVQAYFIPTGSMEDTLLVGDHLLVEKITYGPIIPQMIFMDKPVHLDFAGIREVKRNDIIIFRPPGEEEKDFIKRCIAVAGDEVHIRNGSVYVNGQKLEEPYVKGHTTYRGFSEKLIEGVVPENMVVAMGDNRENSFDSRGFGYLPVERIKGRAFVMYWNTSNVRNLDFSRLGLIQ
ncbi:MAG: signal peptidase I [Spirochaetota bacterium]